MVLAGMPLSVRLMMISSQLEMMPIVVNCSANSDYEISFMRYVVTSISSSWL